MYLIKAKDKVCAFIFLSNGHDNMFVLKKDTLFTTDGLLVSLERVGLSYFIVITAVDDCRSYELHVTFTDAYKSPMSILNREFEILCEF